jgi:hypothetical protein
MELSTILSILGVLIVPAIGYLLNKKDSAQEKEIDELKKTSALLFKKHDDDVAALTSLQLQIAKEHYLKHELDARFASLENAFRDGMQELGRKFDKLTDILVDHVTKEDSRR